MVSSRDAIVRHGFGVALLVVPAAHGCGEAAPAPYHAGDTRTRADAGTRAPTRNTLEPRDAATGEASEPSEPSDAGAQALDAGSAAPGCESGPVLRVLFLGNSYTSANDLPALTGKLACAAGTKLVTQAVAPGGVTLADHATNAASLQAIAAQAWDVAILQDQSQVPGFLPAELEQDYLPGVESLVRAIETQHAGARRVFLMTWARRDGDVENCDYSAQLCTFEGQTEALAAGYALYAERTASEVAPAGRAWAAVRADAAAPLDPVTLWSGDGSHPTLAGSYLAAATLAGHLLDRELSALPESAGLDAALAAYLRGVADATNASE